MQKSLIILHYGEIALKGKNRKIFEKRLQSNIQTAIRSIGFHAPVDRLHGRILIRLTDPEVDESSRLKLIERLGEIPGISYFAVGYETNRSLDAITDTVVRLAGHISGGSFKIETRRSDKTFPMSSPDVNRHVGQAVVDHYGFPVNLNNPDKVIRIEITARGVYIFCDRYEGVGGLPVGVSGRVVSMLSAGFDSPVAAYLMMKRGARVYFVHFHSVPYVSPRSIDQVRRLVRRLNAYQHKSVCYMIPFAEIQKQIIAAAPPQYRILLYRRSMVRLAERIARRHECEALVTGESLGQVASQTLRNIRIIDECVSLPVLRPLIGMDKDEIIALSRRIGTESISAEPYDDCCSFFLPRQVETWGSMERAREIESRLDLTAPYDNAISHMETFNVSLADARIPDVKSLTY